MKKLVSTNINMNLLHFWLLLLRLAVWSSMLTHGIPKLVKLLHGDFQFADPFGIGQPASLGLAVFAEVVCSTLLALGLLARLATIPLMATMLVAIFHAHGADPYGKKELAVLYLLFFITILVLGAGKYSLDQLIGGQKSKRRY